jgi:hypothetical protein
MNIVFGWKLNDPSHPRAANGASTAIGVPLVGPNGFHLDLTIPSNEK